ncbi:MAG: zinc-dependent alcohol dehydrogenase family protein [Candidatus Methylacidiphilales bacterium]
MHAILLNHFGGPEHFRLGTVHDPVPGCGDLLLRVEATSVNPIDVKIRSGAVPALAPDLPAILHGDVVGRVEAVGCGAGDWKIGDRVWGCAGGFKGLGGALAEFMIADARLVARAPENLPLEQAGALPIVGVTAWLAVIERGQVGPGQRILIHGAAGGVGHVALQLAKLAGAHVTATVSSETKAALARQLGADAVVIGRTAPESSFDLVIDTIGGSNLENTFRQIVPGGTAVTIAARTTADLSPLHAKSATFHAVFMALPLLTGKGRETIGSILHTLTDLVQAGRLRPWIDQVFPMSQVAAAHQRLESGQATGKIVLVADW